MVMRSHGGRLGIMLCVVFLWLPMLLLGAPRSQARNEIRVEILVCLYALRASTCSPGGGNLCVGWLP